MTRTPGRDMPQRFTRYVTRDADGNVAREGRVIALETAMAEDLLGKEGRTVVVRPALIHQLGGIFVFDPPVPPEDLDLMEFT